MAGKEFDRTKISQYRRTVYIVLAFFALIVTLVINAVVNPPPPETAAQAEARRAELQLRASEKAQLAERDKQQAERDKQLSEYKNNLCRIKLICFDYHKARQDCAVAGNFDNCIRVRLGDWNYASVDLCTNDGNIKSGQYAADMPNSVDCSFRKAKSWWTSLGRE